MLANDHKAPICHNGSTYVDDGGGGFIKVPISHVITIAGRSPAKAVEKHVANHGDLETYEELEDCEVCKLLDDGTGVDCKVVTLCGPA